MNSDFTYHGPVVVFDLDDTLFRERDYCRSGFKFLCDPDRYRVIETKEYPSTECLSDLYKEMDRELTASRNPFVPFEKLFSEIAGKEDKNFELKKHIEAYRNHTPDSLAFAEGVLSTLETLASRGVKMAIITDGRSCTQRRKIEALGLDKFIAPDLFLISEETGFDKRSKDMFVSIVRHYPEANKFFYVADNMEKDFYFPNLLGWETVKVPSHPDNVHLNAEAPTASHLPTRILTAFSDLPSLIF